MRLFFLILCFSFISASCQEKESINTQQNSKTKKEVISPGIKETPKYSVQEKYLMEMGLVDISPLDSSIIIALKYSTTDNFTKKVLYDSIQNAYLHPIAAEKLIKAQKLLKEKNPELSLIVYDAARPLSVQKKMYDVVQNTRYKAYVANPSRTGLHNYGIAVDLSICNLKGEPLDMGTPFDYFGKEAGITNEPAYLTKKQIENRNLLREVMTKAGFLTIRGEWWHFNALPLAEAKKKCTLIK